MSIRFKLLFLQVVKRQCIYLGILYALYSLIDYSMHMQEFAGIENFSLGNLLLYYGLIFSKRLDFLLPLSLLLASLRTLLVLSEKSEIVALWASGVSKKALSLPFFLLAFIASITNLMNFEFLVPKARNYIDSFEEGFMQRLKSVADKNNSILTKSLSDHSKILFLKEKEKKGIMQDVYWIESVNRIWHIKILDTTSHPFQGQFVDLFERTETKKMEKVASFTHYIFDAMSFTSPIYATNAQSPENKSISTLWNDLTEKSYSKKEERLEMESNLYYKMLMPLLSWLVVIAILPYGMQFSRSKKTFLIYAISLFSFICFFTIMDGCVILAKGNIVSPMVAIALPFCTLLLLGCLNLKRFYAY